MRIAFVRAFVIACGLLLTCELGHAEFITFNPGNDNTGLENINSLSNATPNLIGGRPASRPDLEVDFISSQAIMTAGGFAIVPQNAPLLHDLTIQMADGSAFTKIVFNPQVSVTTPAVVVAFGVTADGILQAPEVFTYPGGLQKGNNFLTVSATGGNFIASLTILSEIGVDSVSQVTRIGGPFAPIGTVPEPPPITSPEPGILSLVGFGLMGFGLCCRKLQRRLRVFNECRPT